MLALPREYCRVLVGVAVLASLGCAASGGGSSASGGRDQSRGVGEAALRGTDLDTEVERLTVERDRLAQTNVVLEDELRWAHEDLRLVERQFSEFEHRLSEDFGKAAAVSATAEARIYFEKERKSIALPDSITEHVTTLLNTAEKLIRANNYPAALFFAERANHTLQGAERRASLNVGTTTRTVAVSGANVREGPGQQYPIQMTLRKGDRVSCVDVARNWCHVVTSDGSSGWIHVSLLQ
jgi:hypothetical protein